VTLVTNCARCLLSGFSPQQVSNSCLDLIEYKHMIKKICLVPFFSEEINPPARFGFKSHRFFKFEFLEKYEKKLETVSSLMLSNVFQTLIIYIVKI
jgi:hypothetical protein